LNVENPVVRSISMRSKTPFLTGFPTRLFGSSKRSAQGILERKRREIFSQGLGELSLQLGEELPPELMESCAQSSWPASSLWPTRSERIWAVLPSM